MTHTFVVRQTRVRPVAASTSCDLTKGRDVAFVRPKFRAGKVRLAFPNSLLVSFALLVRPLVGLTFAITSLRRLKFSAADAALLLADNIADDADAGPSPLSRLFCGRNRRAILSTSGLCLADRTNRQYSLPFPCRFLS